MTGRQKARSEETRHAIVAAAGTLFATRGYEAVSMREIAREAGCSHTAIYLYFKDKEALLHQLAAGPLQALRQQVVSALLNQALPADQRLRQACLNFIRFSLSNRSMYATLFMARAERVDVEPSLDVNSVRVQLFSLLKQGIKACLPPGVPDEKILAYTRICFFTLHGIVSLYLPSDEPFDPLMERLEPTFDLAVTVMLDGFKQDVNKRG